MMNLWQALTQKIASLRSKSLVQDTFIMSISKGVSVFIQGLYFIILARFLGPTEYGAFLSVAAIASIVGPFSGWGADKILVRHVSRDNSLFPIFWGNALFLIISSGVFLALVGALFIPLFMPDEVTPLLVVFIFLADLVGLKTIESAHLALLAAGKVKDIAVVSIIYAVIKFSAAALMPLFLPQANSELWSFLYFLSTAMSTLISVAIVHRLLGTPKILFSEMWKRMGEGFFFSLSTSADYVNHNVDKMMLAKMASLQATGLYGAAGRFLDFVYFPINTIFGTTYARFFQHGSQGIRGCVSFAKKLFPVVIGYGVLAFLCILIFAPVTVFLVGSEFQDVVLVLRWFAPMPLIVGFQKLTGDILTGSEFQGVRSIIQVLTACLNVGLNFWLIPTYSWQGAVWATLGSDIVKLAMFVIVIYVLIRKSPEVRPVDEVL
jgi:O-antigen/teichoic acid export membrane protein